MAPKQQRRGPSIQKVDIPTKGDTVDKGGKPITGTKKLGRIKP